MSCWRQTDLRIWKSTRIPFKPWLQADFIRKRYAFGRGGVSALSRWRNELFEQLYQSIWNDTFWCVDQKDACIAVACWFRSFVRKNSSLKSYRITIRWSHHWLMEDSESIKLQLCWCRILLWSNDWSESAVQHTRTHRHPVEMGKIFSFFSMFSLSYSIWVPQTQLHYTNS